MRPHIPVVNAQARKGFASPVYAILGEMKGALALLFAVGFVVNYAAIDRLCLHDAGL